MRKFFLSFVLALVLMLPVQLQAAGTVTQTPTNSMHLCSSYNLCSMTFNWTSDASGNADQESTFPIDGYIVKVITNPGATAPTDNYDITLTNSDSIDVVHGTLANRDTSTSEEIVPIPADNVALYGGSAVFGKITLNVTNAGDSKVGAVTVIFEREGY